ncbi:MAG: hypothetical protein ACE5PV_23295 [Candidatus Poribacteria bacterium]
MMDKKAPGTTSEFLDRLTELLTNLPDRSTEELKDDLRVEGINPERIVNRVKRLVDAKLDESRLAWLEQARQERAAMLERLREVPSDSPDTLRGIREKISEILSGMWGQQAQRYAHAHFRKLEEVTLNDLKDLLDDLKRLEILESSHHKDKGV